MWNRWVPLTHDEVAELNLDASLEEEREYAAENLKEIMLRRQRLVMDPEKEFSWSDNQADPIDLTAPG